MSARKMAVPAAKAAASNGRAERYLLEPATGQRLARLRVDSAESVMAAARKARIAQATWARLPLRERQRHVRALGREITARADQIAEVVSRSTGKTRMDALSTDVFSGAIMASYYARIARRLLAPRTLDRSSILFFNKVSRLTRVPFGLIGIISPWNYPFAIPLHEVIPALLAGNGVLLKVATQVQPVGDAIAEVVKAAGFPPGLFHLAHLQGAAAADAMLAAGVDKIFFTGSTATGRAVMARAADRLVPVVLELGGNDPMIVLDDANVERAAAGCLWAGLSNAGQSCAAVERVYVEAGAYDAFRDALVRRVQRLRAGPDREFDVEV
ncbi:MAG TPA: aldehyde dehydrogenase family protein, partial [bacterium]|nr:aldehyde dehydrogenase family protein [bacterium]